MRTSFFTSLASILTAVSAQSVPTNGTAAPTSVLPVALPSATATTTVELRAGTTPLICSGTVITAAPASQTASPIAIDSNGILTCTNEVGLRLTGFLREAAAASAGNPPVYDVVLGTPPPVLPLIQGYFTVSNGALSASVSRNARRKRQSQPLFAGLSPAGTLQVGGTNAPGTISATVVGVTNAPGAAPSSGAPSSAPTAAPSNGVAPGVVPVTVTQTNTVTVTAASGAIQTLVVVQVTINGLPVGSVSVFVNINGVLVQVTVTGLSVSGNIVTIGAGFSVAPVVVSVVVIVSPVLYVSAGVTISGVTSVTGFVTAIGGGGAGAVTVINSAAPVTITRTQTIVVPAGTVVPVASGAAVVAVVVAPGSVPVIAAAAAARSNSSTILPAARGTAAKFGVSGLVAGVVAVGVAALF
ncbi:hypothetical protein BCR37DRAFT_379592 [Protomyces lactucae-debilis]|uniref:Uncharacterized protein n=1 Tax=Protomyces lactucae-debilis TaxID=2754530 RepID=A0A1Y2FF85_PROLT|nr:uncharacterized protein BCR37DRAFT_379592 [Protomyces lactucae-debilis]ORY82589.1 hypothetical protein BCR37DRAFT_379592 [Protomyces lactucae-debilis]